MITDLLQDIRRDLARQARGWLVFARNWWALARSWGVLLPLALAAFAGYVVYLDPLPPARAYVGTGQLGTSQRALSERFAQFFARHGIELVLIETGGVDHSVAQLRDAGSPVNASLVVAGGISGDEFPGLVSLGSIQYSPLWMFYRKGVFSRDLDEVSQLLGGRVAVGAPGTATRNILERMLALNGEALSDRSNLMGLPHAQAADRLLEGAIDAMFIVDGVHSPIVQRLLASELLGRYEFRLADAYAAQLPFLDKVMLAQAALDIRRIDPPRDVALLASSVTVVVEKDMHPVLQWLFLKAARELGADRGQLLSRPGTFPAYLDQSMPLSPVAARYYEAGVPASFSYLPLWLAVLVDRMWVEALAFFAVVLPVLGRLKRLRELPTRHALEDAFEEMRELEEAAAATDEREALARIVARLDEIERSVSGIWFDGAMLRNFYSFQGTIRRLRGSVASRLQAAQR